MVTKTLIVMYMLCGAPIVTDVMYEQDGEVYEKSYKAFGNYDEKEIDWLHEKMKDVNYQIIKQELKHENVLCLDGEKVGV